MSRVASFLTVALFAIGAAAQPVPRLDRISASDPAGAFQTTLSGTAGAVPGAAWVIAIHVDTGHYNIGQAAADGSFSMTLFAAPGGTLEIKVDPAGDALRRVNEGAPLLPTHYGEAASFWGTTLQLPMSTSAEGVSFSISGPTSPLPVWYAEGTVRATDPRPGGSIRIDGTYRLLGSGPASPNARVSIEAGWIALARADGSAAIDQAVFSSSVMTPTGLPIERSGSMFSGGVTRVPLSFTSQDASLVSSFNFTLPVPAAFPSGYYRPVILFRHSNIPVVAADTTKMTRQVSMRRSVQDGFAGFLPVIRIGAPQPAQFESTLLLNSFHAGSRGVGSVESRGRFSLAPRIAMAPERLIVPRRDGRSGAALTYSLEPYVPSLAVADRSEPLTASRIPFRFPSGSLTVSVRAPNGTTRTIGPAPLRQALIDPLTRLGKPLENGPSLSTSLRLSTLDPAFNVAFESDGLHAITLDAVIEDIFGTVWRSRGTYEVEVADPLVIDPGLVPGTPFEVGDRLPVMVTLYPAIAADVEVRFRFESASGKKRDETHRFSTNRFGHGAGPSIPLTEAGEYRIDIGATAVDAGRRYAGRITWGNVVAPRDGAIIVQGKRGIDDLPEPRPQWFFRKQLNHPVNAGHTFFPFHANDVQWMTDETQEAGITAVAFHDPQQLVAPAFLSAYAKQPTVSTGNVEGMRTRIQNGEGPVLSLSSNAIDTHIDPSQTDYWSYGYRFVERPLVRIREAVVEEPGPFTYWRLGDFYALQPGNGANGDRTNDFKFQFSGLVIRGSAVATPQYAIYGSLHVIVDRDDPLGTRVTPPFQGNGGGPNGGPLFHLRGKEIDLFVHPTSIRAGTILERGERGSVAGNAAPTLPARIDVTLTSPSGLVTAITGTANKVGHFSAPQQSLIAGETGVWKARIRAAYEGRTSAGQLAAPYPTGDVLGSRDGEFWF
ncbi:MAG TPA: hypothetical protein VFL80_06750, partial [Thermoanaerobaculia bacterium]|nr:hypothetical protein [Thermoanaerobaculia bacterium]